MDPVLNPFSPGAGSPPPFLVGRDPILKHASLLVQRTKLRLPEKSLMLTGLRGVGKTVLLNEIEEIAQKAGYSTVLIEAAENKSLGPLLAPQLRAVLHQLDRSAALSDKAKRALRVLKSFVGSLRVFYEELSFGLDIDPEVGVADSGDLEIDLPALFVAVAEAAMDRGTAVALLIDEIQYFNSKELGALIVAMHKVQQKRLPIVLVGAGLPVLPGLAGNSKSYAERLFAFPEIGALSETDAGLALSEPFRAAGVAVDPAALTDIFELTRGYPYFIQEWGYRIWNTAESSPVTTAEVRLATPLVAERLDNNFFRVRFERLTLKEKRFLRCMASLGPGIQKTGVVADRIGVKVTSIGPVRANLIRKGMIFSPAHGELTFTVPLFDEYMMRVMPDEECR